MPAISRILAVSSIVVGLVSAQQPIGKRRALVIGNGKYANLPAVPASQLNANAVKVQLTTLGFETVLKSDLDQVQMVAEIRAFTNTVSAEDVVFFYYSGYGTDFEGDNYLLPVTYNPKDSLAMAGRAFLVRTFLSQLDARKAGQRIIVLDASWESPGLPENSQGLSMMQPPVRTLVSFNTAMGLVKPPTGNAPDRFTAALVEALKKPGLSLTEIFNEVQKNGVQPGETQSPYMNSTAIDNLVFIPKPKEEPTVVVRDVVREKPLTPGDTRQNPTEQLNYVWIPKGTFQMGCVPGDSKCKPEENPAHPVTISKDFWITTSEVTITAYDLFLAANPARPKPPKTQTNYDGISTENPVSQVSWDDAQAYCKWAGAGGRLPTEAEWEYAARGGKANEIYPFGNTADPKTQANFFNTAKTDLKKRFRETTPVRRFPKNAWNLFDMAGNVREWVADFFDPDAYKGAGPFVDPLVNSGKAHVVRGGAWNAPASDLRNSYREFPNKAFDNTIGFRCVLPSLEAR